MKLRNIYAVLLRHYYLIWHSLDRLGDQFYWPFIDLVVLGLTGTYAASHSPDSQKYLIVIVTGVVLWLIVTRSQYEITVNFLEELWNKNLINFFVSPLKFNEWLCALIMIAFIKGLIAFAFGVLLAFLFFKLNLLVYGFYIIPMFLSLAMTGLFVGFITSSIILRYGTKLQTLGWTAVWVLAPFSGIYFPTSFLPAWAQTISLFIPSSYIFNGARDIIYKGTFDPKMLLISFGLNCIYLTLTYIFLRKSFKAILNKGLVKLY